MKFPRLGDTYTGTPYKGKNGWYVDTFPPIGDETCHGPYRTRKRARWAQHGLKKRNEGTWVLHEMKFWKRNLYDRQNRWL